MNQKKIAISIFLIAFAFGLNITGIMPVLGVLNKLYESKGTSAVQLLQTLPYALLMAGSLMIGWMTKRLSKKNIAMLGLVIIGIFGTLPFFLRSYEMLLLSRICIGFGFGIAAPINTAIVAELFSPEERAGYLGLHVVGMGVGSMVGNLAGGALAAVDYRFFYLVYTVSFMACAGVAVLLPKTAPAAKEEQKNMKLNSRVYLLSLCSFVHTLFITAYNTNIAIYVLDTLGKSTAVTGVVTSVNAAFALGVGALFARISKVLGTHALPASILSAAAGYAAILWIPGIPGVYIGSAFCGASLSCFMAQCSLMISTSVEPEAVAKASGIFSVVGGIGGLISPVIIGPAVAAVMGSNTSVYQFGVSFAGMMVFGILVWVMQGRSGRKEVIERLVEPH